MNEAQYTILRDELVNDPLGRGYATMSDEAVLASGSASDRPFRRLVPLWELKKALIEAQVWPLVVAGQADANPQKAGLCVMIVAYVDDQRFENIDMDLLSTQNMFAGAVTHGLITQPIADDLDALANTTQTRWQELDLPTPRLIHIIRARRAS